MSIVVAVRVGEGLVMAADSASTLQAAQPDGTTGVVKIFNHASKLLQLKDYPTAVATWGAGNLGSRTISSLIDEYANTLESASGVKPKQISVRRQAEGLMAALVDVYQHEYPKTAKSGITPSLGVLVGGYSGQDFFPEEYVFAIPEAKMLRLREPKDDGGQDFGANWYGLTDAIVRLHHGRDDRLADLLKEAGVDDDTAKKVLESMGRSVQYPVPFAGMALQDAVDYAMYLVGVVVGRFRFVAGPELCGGPIDVATVTRERGFQWIQRKKLAARPFGPQI